jgi:hypothetical protein
MRVSQIWLQVRHAIVGGETVMILRAIVVVTGQRTVTVRYPAHQSGISASLPLTNAGLTVFLAKY